MILATQARLARHGEGGERRRAVDGGVPGEIMQCNEIMKRRVQLIAASDSVLAAARRRWEADVAFLPVCNAEGSEPSGTVDPGARGHEVALSGEDVVKALFAK